MRNPDPNSGLQAWISFCHSDGEPLAGGEDMASPTGAAGAAEYKAKFSAQLGAGVVMELMLAWAAHAA